MPSNSLTRLKAKTIDLAILPALNFFELAENLAKLHDEDPSAIADLPDKTGMSRRRVYYLLDVGQLIAASEMSKAEAEEIGWTKLQIIARHVKQTGPCEAEDLVSFLALARQHRARNLAKALPGQGAEATRIVSFELSPTASSELNLALLAHGAKLTPRGLTGKAAALTKMVKAAMAKLT